MPSSVDYSKVSSWRITDFTGIDQLAQVTSSISPPGRKQVAVKIHAVSLNYRDLMVVIGKYPGPKETSNGGLILCSDGAGEVVEVGPEVSEWKVGDRVATTFHTNWEAGPAPDDVGSKALGASLHGTLTEIGVFEETGLVKLPDYLSYEEASTLPCAAVTAWTALLDTAHPLGPQSSVLVLGTGGVSVFAAQIALAAGARLLGTSSSDEKLKVYTSLGANKTDLINYKTTPDWSKKVRELLPNGVEHVIEVGGSDTIGHSIKSVRKNGEVTIIGFVGGVGAMPSVMDVLSAAASIRSILVGSRRSFQRLLTAFEHQQVKPVVDKVFPFDQAKEALQYIQAQKHVGKVVIKVA